MGKLEMKNLTKTFNPGTVNEKTALSGLSLTVEDGDFITIVGSNGAGKSTLFHAIAGVFYVDGGSIVLDGEDITYKPEYRRSREMGRLFQDPMRGTAPHMTIEENMALAYLRTAKASGAKIILLTHYEDSPGAAMADVVLRCGAQESPLDSGSIPIKVAVLYVAEVLVLRFLLDDKQRTTEAQERTTEALAVKML